jgi:hypothetical protein
MASVLLFDPYSGGHHEVYLRLVSEALLPRHKVTAAIPDASAERLHDFGIDIMPLGSGRIPVDESQHFSRRKWVAGRQDVKQLRMAMAQSGADRALHLFADGAIFPLLGSQELPIPMSVVLFRPRAHYPRAFSSPVTPRERVIGSAYEVAVALWRRRRDALRVLTPDEKAAARWARRPGAAAVWLPESTPPWLPAPDRGARAGCAVVGSLAPRKGIELVADALEEEPLGLRVVLAGKVIDGYRAQLLRTTGRMRASGAEVELRDWYHGTEEYCEVLASARCAVVAYPRHYGMSRVLVEAAALGTPVVAHDWGLIGHLVREYGIGLAVDATDPRAMRRALVDLCEDDDAPARYAPALASFASRYTWPGFVNAIADGLVLPTGDQESSFG